MLESPARKQASNSRSFAAMAVLVISAVVVLLIMSVFDEVRFSGDRIGINIAPHEQGILIHTVAPDMPAEAAGVIADDVLIAINGRDADSLAAVDEAVRARPDRESSIGSINALFTEFQPYPEPCPAGV